MTESITVKKILKKIKEDDLQIAKAMKNGKVVMAGYYYGRVSNNLALIGRTKKHKDHAPFYKKMAETCRRWKKDFIAQYGDTGDEE